MRPLWKKSFVRVRAISVQCHFLSFLDKSGRLGGLEIKHSPKKEKYKQKQKGGEV